MKRLDDTKRKAQDSKNNHNQTNQINNATHQNFLHKLSVTTTLAFQKRFRKKTKLGRGRRAVKAGRAQLSSG